MKLCTKSRLPAASSTIPWGARPVSAKPTVTPVLVSTNSTVLVPSVETNIRSPSGLKIAACGIERSFRSMRATRFSPPPATSISETIARTMLSKSSMRPSRCMPRAMLSFFDGTAMKRPSGLMVRLER
jgi:hypothetical protein